MQKPNPNRKRENLLLSLAFNLILPILLLRKGEDWFGGWLADLFDVEARGQETAGIILIVALAFPLGYGVRDFFARQRCNAVSLLGFVSVLFTGGIGLLELSATLFAIKEAALPAIIAVILILYRTKKNSLTRTFLYNPDIIQVDLIEATLQERGNYEKFDRLLTRCSWWLASSFLLSAALNYLLARTIVVTEPADDKTRYNEEVGVMMGWSIPVIAVPCMIITAVVLWRLFRGIRELSGLEPEDIMAARPSKEERLD
ncbi:MAG: VC0807 family protein [Opitutales bacterium]